MKPYKTTDAALQAFLRLGKRQGWVVVLGGGWWQIRQGSRAFQAQGLRQLGRQLVRRGLLEIGPDATRLNLAGLEPAGLDDGTQNTEAGQAPAYPVRLRISETMTNEWAVRGIEDVIPRLADCRSYQAPAGEIEVDAALAQEIAADCRFYLDKDGPETTVGERSAYRGLLRQIEKAL